MKNLFFAGVVVAAGFLLAGCKEEDEKTADSCEQTTGSGGAQCQAMPVCDDKYVQVETCSDGAECVDVELCGVKITCELAIVDDESSGDGGSDGAGGSGGDAPTSGAGGSGGSGG